MELKTAFCLDVCLYVYVCKLSYMPELLADLANGQLSQNNLTILSSLSVLASLSCVFSTAHHVVDVSEFISTMYISLLPSFMHIPYLEHMAYR